MKFAEESYEEIITDILPLLGGHHAEVEWGQDYIPLIPDLETYRLAWHSQSLAMYTIRNEDEQLVGYNTFWLYDHPHHKGTVFAVNDMLYILPAYRHTGYSQGFLYWCENALKERGVKVITYAMKKDHRFEDLMGSLGYEHTECVYSRYVG
jgi:GNAT superfamily N-acetyltransferase